MTDINLNDPRNLNPIIKEQKIQQWNEMPEVKNSGIKAIDTQKYKEVSKPELNLLKIFTIIGIASLVIIAGSIGYSVYKNGSIIPSFYANQTCEAQTVNFDKGVCPSCPSCNCPDCTNECNFPNTLKVEIKNETN